MEMEWEAAPNRDQNERAFRSENRRRQLESDNKVQITNSTERNDQEIERRLPQTIENLSKWPEAAFMFLEDELLHEPNDSENIHVETSFRKRTKASIEILKLEEEDGHGMGRKEAKLMRLDRGIENPDNCRCLCQNMSIKAAANSS